MITRRQFLKGTAGTAFAGLSMSLLGCSPKNKLKENRTPTFAGYGALVEDPNKLLDLPKGFSYRVISELDNEMSDGLPVPDRADGMGCFYLDEHRVVLIRNHELHPNHRSASNPILQEFRSDLAYDTFSDGAALPGGTTNLIYNLKTNQVEKEFLSTIGTVRNCSGGITPWQSWLTCEESTMTSDDKIGQDHGYIFEVPVSAKSLIKPKPLKAMGRFNHEAAAVDPRTGIVYLTEDTNDSLFYRFIPNVSGQLDQGGTLQALIIKHHAKFDSRNWDKLSMPLNQVFDVEWVTLENPESPDNTLRIQGYEKGAVLFARGEGIHWADDELYFCCTSGGKKKLGQIMRYRPSPNEGKSNESDFPGQLQLFLESHDKSLFNFGDNLTVAPNGHLLVCEDQYSDEVDNHLRGVTAKGEVYDFAKIRIQTEPAGACFSPDGQTLFVNLYSPTRTLAITGPWQTFA